MTERFIAVLDFEATCADTAATPDWQVERQEIIEFPVTLVSLDRREAVGSFHSFVRPTEQPRLTAFCTELTSIRQNEVDGQPPITEVIGRFDDWVREHRLTPDNCTVATCGDWDLLRMWPKQAGLVPSLETPALFRRWCNLKRVFSKHTGRRMQDMMGMLAAAGIPHVGRHHRGADDVRNLVALTLWLHDHGASLGATASV
ncbi:MAG: exonuclease domain-containing protein [Deltaproteobacteria bacterium]|nr:exonuclease domain-containing protein [Deltaproteobacteria bacterium]